MKMDTHVPVALADLVTEPIATRSIAPQWQVERNGCISGSLLLGALLRSLRPSPP